MTKRWLISRLKTSGSRKQYAISGDYSTTRHAKRPPLMDLPYRESIRKPMQFYNGKIHTGLIKRFLYSQVGKDWNDVHSEIVARIPTRLLDFKFCIYWYVHEKVEIREDGLWDKKDNRYIEDKWARDIFYVDPETNLLVLKRIENIRRRKEEGN
jgi:hypothetical protein